MTSAALQLHQYTGHNRPFLKTFGTPQTWEIQSNRKHLVIGMSDTR